MVTTVSVAGMITEYCKQAVFMSLSGISGISGVEVKLGTVVVEHDGSVTINDLTAAIGLAGYTVTGGTEEDRGRSLPII